VKNILFRAKRKDTGEMVQGSVVKYGPGEGKYYIVPSYASALYGFEVEPETIRHFNESHDRGWIPVGERLPENEKEVEVSIERRLENGTRRLTCRAIYEDGTIWSESSRFNWNDFDGLDSDLEYSKELDDWKVPQGWFEAATYAEEFAAIGDFVVAWRPLPEPYVVENNQQKKCPFLGFDGHAICFSEGECLQEYLAGCPVYVPTD